VLQFRFGEISVCFFIYEGEKGGKMGSLVKADDFSFETYLNDAKTLVVDFWSPTCEPCKSLEPPLEKMADNYGASVNIVKINVNDCPRTSSRYMVRGLPTILFIKDKNVQSQLVGAVPPTLIEEKLKELIS